jgi:phage terminase large subunit-like protein
VKTTKNNQIKSWENIKEKLVANTINSIIYSDLLKNPPSISYSEKKNIK